MAFDSLTVLAMTEEFAANRQTVPNDARRQVSAVIACFDICEYKHLIRLAVSGDMPDYG